MQFQNVIKLPYKQFLAEVLREAPQDCTWREVSDWLHSQYSVEEIAQMNGLLYKQLCIMTQTEEGDNEEADVLRDHMDYFWFAGDVETNNQTILSIALQFEEKKML
jgi:hypothetical protein